MINFYVQNLKIINENISENGQKSRKDNSENKYKRATNMKTCSNTMCYNFFLHISNNLRNDAMKQTFSYTSCRLVHFFQSLSGKQLRYVHQKHERIKMIWIFDSTSGIFFFFGYRNVIMYKVRCQITKF